MGMKTAPLILVVDDEEPVVTVISHGLERAGYKVISATSAYEAFRVWTNEITLVLSDSVAPDPYGNHLTVELLRRKPELKLIFMSGSPIDSFNPGIPLRKDSNFIQKPFGIQELLSLVRSTLA